MIELLKIAMSGDVELRESYRASKKYIKYWTIYKDGKRIGKVSVYERNDKPFIDIKINKKERGNGYATKALSKACTMSGCDEMYGLCRSSNAPSIGAMKSAGFVKHGKTDMGQPIYRWRK